MLTIVKSNETSVLIPKIFILKTSFINTNGKVFSFFQMLLPES